MTNQDKIKNFFEKIDTQEKAYWLGFMYADGNCYNNYAKIGLQERDGYILKHFMAALESNQPVHKLNRVKEHHQDISYVTIYSKKLVSDLNKLGCIPNKTKTLTFPDYIIVPQHLMHHFIRGYFDGDGCYYINEKRSIRQISLSSSLNQNYSGIDKLFNSLNIKYKIRKVNSVNSYSVLRMSSKKDCNIFINFLGNSLNVGLQRKIDKINKIKT